MQWADIVCDFKPTAAQH